MAERLKRLDGTVALVTGASSGIGAATARTLVAQSAAVALAARRTERLAHLAQDITSAGGRALSIATDVSDNAQAQVAIVHAMAQLGRLDTLVNNADVGMVGPIKGAPLEEWEQMGACECAGGALHHPCCPATPAQSGRRWPTPGRRLSHRQLRFWAGRAAARECTLRPSLG